MFMRKSSAYLIGANNIAESNRELGEDIVGSNRELARTLKDISDAEIKSKNRVDITLEEYMNMKDEIKALTYERDRLSNILRRIEIPFNKEIILDSIRTYYDNNYKDFRTRHRIEFEVDDLNLMG